MRLVVFDLDGTLVDSSRDLATAVNRTLARLSPGTPPLDVDTVRSFIGNGATVLVARSLEQAGIPRPVGEVLPLFLAEYESCLLDTTRLYAGMAAVLPGLGGRLAVLTNKPGDLSRRLLEALGLGDRFFRVVGGGDLPSKKPDPEGLRRLMAEAGATPQQTVMVGDSAIDVLTGRAAGAWTIGVRYGFDAESLSAAAPDVVVERPEDLPAALRALGAGPVRESVLP